MYTPKSFEVTDPALIAQIIECHSFGTLVTNGEGGLQATHLPFEFDQERNVLRCHMARANPQWRDFGDEEILTIFHGTHGYISPRWYSTQLAVPTWNYIAVHVYGVPGLIEDDDEVVTLLENLVAEHESWFEKPWKLEAPDEWQRNMRRAIVAFEVQISRIEAKAKMSQNRPAEDISGVIAGLEANKQNELADWVRRLNSQS